MKVVIIGGVAAGAGAAARLRRLDERAEIVMLERGAYISYANCGLPYHVGGVIPNRQSLVVMPPEKFKAWFGVDVRVNSEVVAIDRAAKQVVVRGPAGEYREGYDRLVVATGSSPVMMDLPGSDDPRVTRLWTIPDMDGILAKVRDGAKRAVVIGAGFIGLETAENLAGRGLDVTVVELMDQVLPTIDREMATPLAQELSAAGIALRLGRKVVAFEHAGDALAAVLDSGEKLPADLVVMSVGVKPNSEIAKAAGLEVGPRGHVVVDAHLRTSDPDIYAAGDVVEVVDPIFGGKTAIPLAGPANKQARILADNLVGRDSVYAGSYGSAVLKVGALTAASVGWTERRLRQMGVAYEKLYTHPASSASYYPGAMQIHLKLLFAKDDGRILGAQIVGGKGVDKRIDVIATAMRAGLKAPALAELELAYAPPFSSAKDPVNFAGMIAESALAGDTHLVHADAIPEGAVLLDVREPAETGNGTIPGSVTIPLGQLRARLGELDKAKPVVTVCQVGLRGYLAERILRQNGFVAANLSGGYLTWKYVNPAPFAPAAKRAECAAGKCNLAAFSGEVLDVRALACPGPVVRLKQKFDSLDAGETVKVLAPAGFEPDLRSWASASGHEIAGVDKKQDHLEAVVRKGAVKMEANAVQAGGGHSAAIVLFSNDLDKALAAMIIACGMAASGAKVGIFFTFWGLSVLRKDPAPAVKKNLLSRMFGMMLPTGAAKLSLSKMHMAGVGTAMMKHVMASQNVPSLPELLKQARELGVKFIACDMAMGVMGVTREELIEVDEVAGVASFVELAKHSNNTLFF